MKPKTKSSNYFEVNPKKTIVLVVLISIGLMLVIAEHILRSQAKGDYWGKTQRAIRLREQQPLYAETYAPGKENEGITDSLAKKQFSMSIDNNGFIIPSKKYEVADVNIVFLGGSTTECKYVDEYLRFPYLTGVLLEKKTGKKVNSFNSGVCGNNSLHSIDILLNKVIPMHPDIVVMMHNVNDLTILLYEKTYWNLNYHKRPVWYVRDGGSLHGLIYSFTRELKDITFPYLYERLKQYIKVGSLFNAKTDEFADCRGRKALLSGREISDYKENLKLFICICRIKHIVPVLMTQENRITLDPDPVVRKLLSETILKDFSLTYDEFRSIFNSFNNAIREVCKEEGVALVDLAKDVPQTSEFMYDLVHFNDAGSKLAAEIISSELIRQSILSVKFSNPHAT